MYYILLFDGRFIPNGCGSMWTRNRSTSTVWFSNSETIKGLSPMRLSIDESKVQYLMPFDSQMVISKRQVDGFTSFTFIHDNDVKMSAIASQITGVYTVCSTVGSGGDRRKHHSSPTLAFVRGMLRSPVNSPHKRSVTSSRWCSLLSG